MERLTGAFGLSSAALLIPSIVVVGTDRPAPDASTASIVAYLLHNRGPYRTALFFEIFSLASFICFLGGLRVLLNRARGNHAWIVDVAFAAGVAFAALILVEDAAFAAAAVSAGLSDDAASVRAMWDFGFLVAWPFGRGVGVVMLAGFAAAGLRSGRLPKGSIALAGFAALANLAFIPTLFSDRGTYVAGGVLAEWLAVGLLEAWVAGTAVFLVWRSYRPLSRSAA